MLLNNQLALDVLAAWVDDQNHPHRGRSAKPIPSEQDLAVLLDTTFIASLLYEEEKPVSTSVTWVTRDDFENHEIGRMRDSRLTLEFDERIDFEAHNLAKLSGIVNGKTGTLLACRTESSAYIWGVCYFMGGTGPIGEIPVMAMEVRHFSPDYPTVTVTGVGSMQITRGGTVIGRVEGGKFRKELGVRKSLQKELGVRPLLYKRAWGQAFTLQKSLGSGLYFIAMDRWTIR